MPEGSFPTRLGVVLATKDPCYLATSLNLYYITFTHLADSFIQSDLQLRNDTRAYSATRGTRKYEKQKDLFFFTRGGAHGKRVFKRLLKLDSNVPARMVFGSSFHHLGTTKANSLDCDCLVCGDGSAR